MSLWRDSKKLLLLTLAAVLSCGGSPIDQPNAFEIPPNDFQVIFDIADEALVAIAKASGEADTLFLSQLNERIERLSNLAPDVMEDPVQARKMKKEIVDSFLQSHAILVAAKGQNISVDPQLLNSELSAFKSRFEDEDSFGAELKAMNMSEEAFEEDTRERIQSRLFMESVREAVGSPDSDEVDKYIVSQQESRSLAHILFSFDRVSEEIDLRDLQQLANSVLDSLQNGADFSQLARRHSDDGSRRLGGDLGFVERGQMVKDFEDAAFNLQKHGDISQALVQTVFGLHIIKFLSSKTNPPMDRVDATERLFSKLKQDAVNSRLRLLKSNAVLHLNAQHIQAKDYRQ